MARARSSVHPISLPHRSNSTMRTSRLPLALLALISAAGAQEVATVQKISFTSTGAAGNGDSIRPSISGDGRYVAFESGSDNLTPFDVNSSPDIFVYDRQTSALTKVSVGATGAPANSPGSNNPAISADGRWVAFDSASSTLVPGDTNGMRDVFVKDRQTGAIERVNVSTAGVVANLPCVRPTISGDGRYVAFETTATNLDPADTSGLDAYVRDRLLGTTTRVTGAGSPFWGFEASFSANGQQVAFTGSDIDPGDTNSHADIYVHDVASGVYVPISTTPAGVFGNDSSTTPSISADGTRVAFLSRASNFAPGLIGTQVYNVYLRDMLTGQLLLVSANAQGVASDGECTRPAISGDGRHVVFTSRARNLVPNDSPTSDEDVYAYDSQTGLLVAVSVSAGGVLGQGFSEHAAVSHDGLTIAYHSTATNLIPEDSVGLRDVFVAYRGTLPTYRSFCYSSNATFCPCSNQGLDGRGCGHSASAFGAVLRAVGDASVTSDTVRLEGFNLPANVSALIFQGTGRQNGGQGTTFGDGLRCAAGTVIRLGTRTTSASGLVQLGSGVAGDAPISVTGVVPAGGGPRTYQVWYRNAAAFCTPSTFNLTNGIETAWRP